jgi:hypothetical protein
MVWELLDLEPRLIALARAYLLVREGDSQQETSNYQIKNKNLVMGSTWGPDTKTRLIVGRNFIFGIQYMDLALQVGKVSEKTANYGSKSCLTLISKWLYSKLQTNPFFREGAPNEEPNNCHTKEKKRNESWHGSHRRALHQDRMAHWPSVLIWMSITSVVRRELVTELEVCSGRELPGGRLNVPE